MAVAIAPRAEGTAVAVTKRIKKIPNWHKFYRKTDLVFVTGQWEKVKKDIF